MANYLVKESIVGNTSDGRPIYQARCKLCNKLFANDRSGYKHLRAVHQICSSAHNDIHKLDEFFEIQSNMPSISQENTIDERDVLLPEHSLNEHQRKLILLICNLGIPLQAISKREWMEFLEVIGANLLVQPKKLRSFIMIYKGEIMNKIRNAIAGKDFTLITDGGTVCERTYYVCIIFCDRKLYFAGLAHVTRSDHVSIAKGIHDVIDYYLKKGSNLIGIVSDNASNLLLATTDQSQPGPKMNLRNQITNIQSLINMKTLHISCGIHTANLILTDMMSDQGFKWFKEGLLKLFRFLREKDIRLLAREKNINSKIPLIQEIKWLCYLQAINFLCEFHIQIDEILKEKKEQKDTRIDIQRIPNEWNPYLQSLKPFCEFILISQKSSFLLYEFYQEQVNLLNIWSQINTKQSLMLCNFMKSRFTNTAYGSLAKLSWFLTKEGHDSCRNRFMLLFQPNILLIQNTEYLRKLIDEKKELLETFIKVHDFYGFMNGIQIIPILFDKFLLSFEFTLEPLKEQYTRLGCNVLRTNFGNISWSSFAITASRIVGLPASEAVAERVISQLTNLFPKHRSSSKPDLVEAQIMVRMQSIFDIENSVYDINAE